MQFRRSGQRDERRRRVMIDERVTAGDRAGSDALADSKDVALATARAYSDAALADRQPRVTDLIPKRNETFLLLLLAGLTVIVGLEALYGQVGDWGRAVGTENLAAFQLTAPASLAGWFSSVLLATSGVTSLMIFTIRRHREDDYRGRYRIWIWVAVVWFLGSLSVTAPVDDIVGGVIAHLTGAQLADSHEVFSTLLYAVLLATVVIPVLADVRHCRSAIVAFVVAGVGYVLAASIRLNLLLADGGALAVMAGAAAAMLAHLLLLMSMGLYARHVFLDAQGLLPLRLAKPKQRRARRRKTKEPVKPLKVVSDDLGEAEDEPKPGAATKRRRKRPASSPKTLQVSPRPTDLETEPEPARKNLSARHHNAIAEEIAALEAKDPGQLNKAQRRRLRKLKTRQLRKAG